MIGVATGTVVVAIAVVAVVAATAGAADNSPRRFIHVDHAGVTILVIFTAFLHPQGLG